MRNLKKFLALVMAMVMAFSLMVTANATTTGTQFDDAKDVTPAFEEAVDVLVGMKVFQGDEGGFRPASNITRAEVAALIYRLATGDVDDVRAGLYANYGNFSDVNESDWFAGYVGYCANAGYIKGTSPTTFNPYGNVTGYEVLAMVLRAIGYDKNNEFVGATWQTNVSALATQLGILDNIKTTHYGNTLHLASRRDVVAELLFQADSDTPMVTYTTAFGYQQTGMTGGVVGDTTNPTLGKHIFGLTNEERIVVGNQETGENCTVMGATKAGTFTYLDTSSPAGKIEAQYTMYAYPGGLYKTKATAGAPATGDVASATDVKYPSDIGVKLDVKTGLELFGHKLNVWYSDTMKVDGAQKTFAYFDKATSVTILDDGDTAATGTAALASGARAEGLTLNNTAHLSQSFSRIEDQSIANKPTQSFVTSPEDLYVLIDNNGDKTVDVIIPLNVQTSQVTAVDNVNAITTVQVPQVTTAPAFDADVATDWQGLGTTIPKALIEQDALVGNSTKTLGDYEIGIHVNGTKYDDAIAYWSATETYGYKHNHTANVTASTHAEDALFRLTKLETTKQGQVASFNDVDGIVVLSDGTRLERSLFYHTVVGNNFYTNSTTAADSVSKDFQSWQFDGTNYKEGYTNGTYRFYLDADGKYVGAVRVQDLGFVYGTYLDYDQMTSSSSFNYYITGVDLDGNIIESEQVTSYNNIAITGTNQVGIPFRDTLGNAGGGTAGVVMNGIGTGVYKGMTLNNAALNSTAASLNVIGVTQGNDGSDDYFDNITIRSGDVNLGAKAAKPATTTLVGGDVAATSTNALYFTNNTKIILVSGYGTDSVKAEVFNGITDLLGDDSSVSIDFNKQNTTDGVNIPHISDVTMDSMTYFTQSDFVYAQTLGTLSKQIDTIILPAAAVTRANSSNLYYVGNPAATLWNGNVTGEKATQFTMYKDGEAESIWIEGLSYEAAGAGNSAHDVANSSDTFWQLRATSKKTNTGETIYQAGSYASTVFTERLAFADPNSGDAVAARPTAVGTTGNNGMAHVTYNATTYDAQIAAICGALKNVSSAKIVNLNAKGSPVITANNNASGYVWPGIDDTLATLNNAGSVAGSGAYASQNLYVSVVYSNDVNYVAGAANGGNSTTAAVIYVCWDQNPTT